MNKLKSESNVIIEPYLAWLYGRINYERQIRVTPRHFKLRNMREILGRLGNPHLKYQVIHVAGTKGKGSVTTMLGSILTTSGRKTGVYTSPHLETIHQRMAIDGNLISDEQLVETLSSLQPFVAEMDRESELKGFRPLTFFEITTAAAFQFFATQNCDAVALEVGLGGRLDSTNVCEPVACVITNISLDHTKQLGSTIDKIAFEKAGIIKNKIPVVSGALHPDAHEVITQVANENDSPLFVLDRDFESSVADDESFQCSGKAPVKFQIDDLRLPVLGQHQQTNASLAIAAIETLNASSDSWNISNEQIREGLATMTLTGRTERMGKEPVVIVDMAHNVASIEALVSTLTNDLPEWKTSSRKSLIVALTREKDAQGILEPLIKCFDRVVITRYRDNPRGRCEIELHELANQIQNEFKEAGIHFADVVAAVDPETAWESVWAIAEKDETICITGSAFLVAELRKTVLASVRSASMN